MGDERSYGSHVRRVKSVPRHTLEPRREPTVVPPWLTTTAQQKTNGFEPCKVLMTSIQFIRPNDQVYQHNRSTREAPPKLRAGHTSARLSTFVRRPSRE